MHQTLNKVPPITSTTTSQAPTYSNTPNSSTTPNSVPSTSSAAPVSKEANRVSSAAVATPAASSSVINDSVPESKATFNSKQAFIQERHAYVVPPAHLTKVCTLSMQQSYRWFVYSTVEPVKWR